jgi:hypothetical protein
MVIVMWLRAVWWINTDVTWPIDSYRFMGNDGANRFHRNVCTFLSVKTALITYLLHGAHSFLWSWFSATQEIPRILLDEKFYYRSQNCPPPVPILSQLDPFRTPTSHFTETHLNIFIPSSPGPFPQVSHQNPVWASPPYVLHAPPISFFSIWLQSTLQYCS